MQSSSSCRFLLTSESAIKKSVVESYLRNTHIVLDCKNIPSAQIQDNVEQPVGIGGLICCKNRILATLRELGGNANKLYSAIISIENAIECNSNGSYDMVHIMIYDTATGIYYYGVGGDVYFHQRYYDTARDRSTLSPLGWSYTVGEAMKDGQLVQNEKNWMAEIPCKRTGQFVDRHTQIASVLGRTLNRFNLKQLNNVDLKANLGYDLDFKKGVVFQDLGPIMASRPLFDLFTFECMSTLSTYNITTVDYVVGIGARGFYLGPLLAKHLGAGFVPIRKKNKLPGHTVSNAYTTEYSSDEMEIQTASIPVNYDTSPPTVLIVDDLVATGGSLVSAVRLLRKAFGPSRINVVGCFCPLYVEALLIHAKERLMKEANVNLITF